MAIYDCTPDGGNGGGGTTYTAGDGIEIQDGVISVKISQQEDNATGILNGALYTPVSLMSELYPLVVVSILPATPSVQITAKKGDLIVTGETDELGQVTLNLSAFGVWEISGTIIDELISVELAVGEIKEYQVTLNGYKIYGVIWDGSANSTLARTDLAELFPDPQPAINNGTGSSPFDNIMPWSGMQKVEDDVAGTLVSIPKYWYKWTKSGNSLQLQISSKPVEGFYVSPAHADRGDGQGERDFVYVGRYHCNFEFKSQSKSLPGTNILIENARNSITSLGDEYFVFDYAMVQTINMLYLVEFADWNFKKVIGYGSGNNSSLGEVGYTDDMKYHTGTSVSGRLQHGLGTQYRHIEGLRDNCYDLIDGIYFLDQKVYYNNNPKTYSNGESGEEISEIPSTNKKQITSFSISEKIPFLLIPSIEGSGSESTYTCSYYYYSSGNRVGFFGSSYLQNLVDNIFNFGSNFNYGTPKEYVGTRIQKLPNAT